MKNFWLSPNTEKDDVDLAIKILFGKRDNQAEEKLRLKLAEFLKVKSDRLFLFNAGRSAFYVLLNVLPIKRIALQAYTCNAAVNPVLWADKQPVFVDIDESWNLDPAKIPSDVDAVVVQHTFGIPARLAKLKDFCRRNKLLLIEDCAHALGGRYWGKKLGKWGDFAFFSFGRDKVISSVYGGALLVNNPEFLERIREAYQNLPYPSWRWTYQQLLHPFLMEKAIFPLYNFCSIGKIILYLSLRIGLLSLAVATLEKIGKRPDCFPARLPSSLALLSLCQLKKIDRLNNHRYRLASLYQQLLLKEQGIVFQKVLPKSLPVYLRFGIMVDNAKKIQLELRRKKIFLDRWLSQPVGPAQTSLKAMGYKLGSCPQAEKLAEKELQFPTGIKVTVREGEELVKLFLRIKK